MRMMLILGVAVAALAWLGPLPAMTAQSFSAHMVLHLAIIAAAAPLIGAGLARSRILRLAERAPIVLAALPAALFEWVTTWAWHVPGLHHAAHASRSVFMLEQATFAVAGLWLWLAVLQAPSNSTRVGTGIIALVLTFAHMTLLGAIIALAPRPLFRQAGGHSSVDALIDQELGGILMIGAMAMSCLAGIVVLTRRLLASPSPSARRA
jgi:putative membrane protein